MSLSKHYVRNIENINLLFCLDWFALIGENSLKEINKIAKNYKASHICLDHEGNASAGLAFIDKKTYYSAAQLFAQYYSSETIAMVLQLDSSNWWLVAAQKGSVITLSDKIYASKDLAQKQILGLQALYIDLKIVYVTNAQDILIKLAANAKPNAIIQPTKFKVQRLLKVGSILSILLLSAFVLSKSLDVFDKNNDKELTGLDIDNSWQLALKQATSNHNLHDVKAIIKVLESIYSIPVAIQGWLLSDAQCLFINMDWQCSANYYRNHLLANNKNLIAAMPNNWQVSFDPLDKAHASWQLNNEVINVLNAELKTSKHNETFLFSELQALMPALPTINIQKPKPISLVAPIDEQGQSLPKPSNLPIFSLREFQIKAPLRSLGLLLMHSQSIAWKKISLVMHSNLKPSLTASAINVTLDGVLYEKN